ncbi:hypothetical protein ACHAQH_010039, partial [Verticillium albo-atrum]
MDKTTNDVELVESSDKLGHISGGSSLEEQVDIKKLTRKIDWTLLPFITLLYLLSFLDRTNIGNATLDTLEADLGMSGIMYNNALAIFFPFYVIAEIPSNIAMNSYEGLLAARAVLGLAEGGLFPGIAYFITMWYRRHECDLRLAIFFSAATLAGAFGGLLARGILEMGGVAGLAGWRWLFILEGIATVLVACIAVKVIQDYPEKARFLPESERKVVLDRLQRDRSSLANDFNMKYVDADKVRQRGIFLIVFMFVAIVGLIMLTVVKNVAVRYVGCFFAAAGICPSVPQGVAWNGNNIGGGLKRGIGIAMHVGFARGICYLPDLGSLLGLYVLALVLCVCMTAYLRRENARRD